MQKIPPRLRRYSLYKREIAATPGAAAPAPFAKVGLQSRRRVTPHMGVMAVGRMWRRIAMMRLPVALPPLIRSFTMQNTEEAII